MFQEVECALPCVFECQIYLRKLIRLGTEKVVFTFFLAGVIKRLKVVVVVVVKRGCWVENSSAFWLKSNQERLIGTW